ncbi:CUB domain-containing protein 1a [Melanotaenia boesemani]|uniref:CUB domain-containing protein 1a n=1 Tax=Melanotaenia boesemani TaxID=1250792 RepID=UPI001C046C6D|nr:CUB domain-containing protein 1a [Melanotaenia boesemani]
MSLKEPGSVSLQLLLLTVIVSAIPGIQKLTITPDHGTTINISSTKAKGCSVCTGSGNSQQCRTSLLLKNNTSVLLEFKCPKPEDVFRVEVVQNIECSTSLCSSHIIQADLGSLPLLEFPRRFTWNVKAFGPKAFKLDFTETGLKQINPSEDCPEKHTYILQIYTTKGNIVVGKYCRVGDIINAQILNQGSFSLDVPAGQKLQRGQFHVSPGEEIKSLAKISLTLPKGTSSLDLLSPNYPDSFPDNNVMEWYFRVPENHKASVQFLNLTQPQCLKNTAVEYKLSSTRGKRTSVWNLNNVLQELKEGSFFVSLSNCEMDRRRALSPGLSLNLRVSSRSNLPVTCKVDPSETEGLDLYIHNLRPDSECEMKMNSKTMRNITVTSNSQLSFQGCSPGDVQVTARRVIVCSHLKDCQKALYLQVPVLPSCIPASLSSVTWILRPPQHGSVQITSPTGYLKRDLPEQPCNDSFIIEMAEEDGHPIGRFCPQGAIQKVLIHTNVSVTWRASMGIEGQKYGFAAAFENKISEKYIFYVSPLGDTPIFVASPGWPVGMKDYSTISWIVTVPEKKEALLKFFNQSRPKCSEHHATIVVQRIGKHEEDYSRREDEEAKSEITVPESFYFNMSNCKPERRDFGIIIKITLQKRKNFVFTVILSVVAVLLAVLVTVLVVVCIVIRKKKKELSHQVSIYNSGDANFLPGQNGLPNSEPDSESHVYASIDDTLVYTHLLKKGADKGIYDAYQSFKGHKDSQSPVVSQESYDGNQEVNEPHQFSSQGPPLPSRPLSHIQPLMGNEIYPLDNQSEEEGSPNLGPCSEEGGGN